VADGQKDRETERHKKGTEKKNEKIERDKCRDRKI
jgi:hypothetical protein